MVAELFGSFIRSEGCGQMNRRLDAEFPSLTSAMPEDQIDSQRSFFRRTIDLWPYLFIIISVTGLTYVAITAIR
jgi:hypothetical protein